MRAGLLALALLALTPAGALAADEAAQTSTPPEARPYDETADAKAAVDAALDRAARENRKVILVFGANWCGDSRALAGWFATPRFQAMLAPRYEIVWIDVGQRDRNLDLARRFGLGGISGTPTVLILDAQGKPLNLKDAPRWRNAASRSEDAIFAAFAGAR